MYPLVTKAIEPGWALEFTAGSKINHAQGSPCILRSVVGFPAIYVDKGGYALGPLHHMPFGQL